MALPTASTSLRSLRSVPIQAIRGYATIQPYSPPSSSSSNSSEYSSGARRPNRPESSEFFTGRPKFNESLKELNLTIESTKSRLRSKHIYPLPTHLPNLNPPSTNWISKEEFSNLFNIKLKTNTLRQVLELLTELNHLRFITELSGENQDLVNKINVVLNQYERNEQSSKTHKETKSSDIEEDKSGIDEFGRSYSMGRKKTSSSRVWLIPSQALLSTTSPNSSSTTETSVATASNTKSNPDSNQSQILINHIPLSQYFIRPSDRETILRPLKITGYLGAFNIFGFSRGGGLSSQASAVGLGVARALSILRDDARDILQADGALMRDTRMTERKKTGRAKARKGYTWVKR